MGQSNSTRQGNTDTQSEQRPGSASAEPQNIEPWKVSRDKVKILKEIGVGGWGSVSEGTLRVAVKQLHPQIHSQTNIDRLQREMQILAQLRHPNLVQLIGIVLDEAALKLQAPPMIVTELLDKNLRKAYEEELDFNKLSIFQDVARGLNYLHECHDPIIHRDVSAPNVLLEALPNGTWRGKVSDLGSANLAKLAYTVAAGCHHLYCLLKPSHSLHTTQVLLHHAKPQRWTCTAMAYFSVRLSQVNFLILINTRIC